MPDTSISSLISTISATPTVSPVNVYIPEQKTDWIPALITGLTALGVVLINEYFKRKEKANLFTEGIFKRKLALYEGLYNIMSHAYEVAFVMFEDKNLTKEERHKIWSKEVILIADFIDKHFLYLNEVVTMHCAVSLIGVDDIPELEKKEKTKRLKKFFQDKKDTVRLIKEESGLERLDGVLKGINKPKLSSEYINYFDKLKEERKVGR